MAQQEGNGLPFENPCDEYERTYNARLEANPASVEGEVFDPINGWPMSTKNYQQPPTSDEQMRHNLNLFFDANHQHRCLAAGNTPQELDLLAKRLLTFAAMRGIPVTDRERTIASRVGVDLDANPRLRESPYLPGK